MEGIELALRDIVEELKTMNAKLSQLGEINLTLDAMHSLSNKLWRPYTPVPYDGLPDIKDIRIETPKDNLDNIK